MSQQINEINATTQAAGFGQVRQLSALLQENAGHTASSGGADAGGGGEQTHVAHLPTKPPSQMLMRGWLATALLLGGLDVVWLLGLSGEAGQERAAPMSLLLGCAIASAALVVVMLGMAATHKTYKQAWICFGISAFCWAGLAVLNLMTMLRVAEGVIGPE